MTRRLIGALLLNIATCLCGQAQTDNTIIIEGKKPEMAKSQTVVNQTKLSPKDASRFDIATYFKKLATVQTQNSGAIKNSGFFLPRIRGQDARSSEVYLNDIPLSNPYTGLPIVDDIDLRAFDEGIFYQGLSDASINSVNPVGALNLKFNNISKPNTQAGAEYGAPHGRSGWVGVKDFRDGVAARIYVRQHQTDGRYRYYSDEGTPYNTSDDRIRLRTDNARSSTQAIFNLQLSPRTGTDVGFFSLLNQVEQGLPAMGGQSQTNASSQGDQGVHQGYLEQELIKEHSVGLKMKLFRTHSIFHTLTSDPENRIVATRATSRLDGDDDIQGLSVAGRFNVARINMQIDRAVGRARLNRDLQTEREQKSIYLGGEVDVGSDRTTILVKIKQDQSQDKSSSQTSGAHVHQSFGSGLQQKLWHKFTASVQGAYVPRSPSLFETFGDGGAVQESDGLQTEVTRHKEATLRWDQQRQQVGLTYFRDQTDNKIVLLPSGNPNAWQASNLYSTTITGWDFWLSIQPVRIVDFSLSYLQMHPHVQYDGQTRQIPGLAQHHFSSEIGVEYWSIHPRWHSHYRGPYYRDLSNSVRYGEVWMHDASIDFMGPLALRAGVGVYNVFDQKSMMVETTDGKLTGRTAVSELNGYPLPGRSFKVFVSLNRL